MEKISPRVRGKCLSSTVAVSIQVIVPETERSTALFGSVTLRCDYSTSSSSQDVIVTWKYKSFCKDPVLEYYSTAYQSALQLGQDPANDCSDSQRTVRTVVQKKGTGEAILGGEYQQRKITVLNKADLQITEVMWWDNGMYFCQVDAPGDTVGDNDKEIKLIVYHWLVVLFIIIGVLLLLMLCCICCCQCCPQACCCYVRCPCCPQQCCCPEKLVMQHRMMKDAQRAMAPWMGGPPMYAPMSQMSSQMNPVLYSGTSLPMKPMPLPPPQSSAYSMPPPSARSNNTNQMLDYLESQVRGMDVNTPLMQMPPPPQHMPNRVPFSPGPPSMLSALDDVPNERRSRAAPPAPKTRPPSSSESSRSGGGMDRPRSRSRDDLFDSRSRSNYSPPATRRSRGSWSSDEESRRGGGRRGGAYGDKPPSYTEYEPEQKPRGRRNDRYNDARSRTGTSVVI
uniref:Ig-like domain-containing protein n=1 Tax=Periophthalmus magnuspinnatus TaxID=409849 RepID=A0A3B3ZRF4_9GOBI